MRLLLLLTALLALALQLGQSSAAEDDYCFGSDKERPQTHRFAAKTAYQIVKGKNMDKQYLVPGCQPKKIWIYHRHGTRLVSKKIMGKAPKLEKIRDKIVKNYGPQGTNPEINRLCPADLLGIKMWKWNTTIMDEYLTSQGYEDLRGTAKSYQSLYPSVLTGKFNKTYYLFRHTDTQRTNESFKGFAEGLFGDSRLATAEDIPAKDLLLRPYEYCNFYRTKNFRDKGSEFAKYREAPLWNQTLKSIRTRLGFNELDEDDILLMYDMCRYEQAWYLDRTSVWCAAFLKKHLDVLEYSEDLKYYYGSGYGYEENTRFNCRAVQDMLTRLSSPVSPHVIAYFAHSAGLQMFLASLGIARDTNKLRADNYNASRLWSTSLVGPFASNFLAVKYDCPGQAEQEKAMFFLNEKVVQFDWCKGNVCNWSDVLNKYKHFSEANCDEYFCPSGAAAGRASLLVTALIAVIAYLMH